MSPTALIVAGVAGLVVGRAGLLLADRFTVPRSRRRIPLQEAVTALAVVAVAARFDAGWEMLPPLVAVVSLITLSAVDFRSYRLPDLLTLPSIGLSLVAVAAHAVAVGRVSVMFTALAVALSLGVVMWGMHKLRPDSLGFGDVKLAPLLGLHLGWAASTDSDQGWTSAVVLTAEALLVSSLIGLAMGLVLGMLRRQSVDPDSRQRLRDTVLPFGPALAAGTMIAVFYTSPLLA